MGDALFEMLGNCLNPNAQATLQEMEDFTYTPYEEVFEEDEKEKGGKDE